MSTVREEWDMCCPKCGHDDMLDVTCSVAVRLYPNGTDADESFDGSHTWNDTSPVRCDNISCGWEGTVFDCHQAVKNGVITVDKEDGS